MLDIPATSLESCSDGRNPTCSSPRASSCWWRHRCHWSYWWASLVFMLPAPRLEVQCCVWHVTMRLDFRFQTCFAGMKSATVTVIRPLRGSINTKHVRKARWGALPVLLFWAPGSLLTLSLAQHSRADGQLRKKRCGNGTDGLVSISTRSIHCFYPFQK